MVLQGSASRRVAGPIQGYAGESRIRQEDDSRPWRPPPPKEHTFRESHSGIRVFVKPTDVTQCFGASQCALA